MRRLRRLLAKRSERWAEGVCVIEGPDLVSAAFDARAAIDALYVDRDARGGPEVARVIERARDEGVAVFDLAPGVLERVADAATPQPVLATVQFSTEELTRAALDGLVLVLDNLRDPGNLGTIIRSADAAGVRTIILSGDCVDPYNPKTLRATAGAIFRVSLVEASLDATTTHLRARGVRSYATVLRGATPYQDCDLRGPCAVLIGNESAGLSEDALARCDARMTIEMVGTAESLNAGVAASLIAFEALRQRRATTDV